MSDCETDGESMARDVAACCKTAGREDSTSDCETDGESMAPDTAAWIVKLRQRVWCGSWNFAMVQDIVPCGPPCPFHTSLMLNNLT